MYTYNNLFDELVSFPNLMRAAHNAQRGKRTKSNPARFNFFMEREILKLQEELISGSYRPGEYRSFYVYEPKARLISAAPYRDRVIHSRLGRDVVPQSGTPHAFCPAPIYFPPRHGGTELIGSPVPKERGRIIEPIFEARFIHHSYACRVGKGTHRAIDKCQSFIQNNHYVLKADIKKFFPRSDLFPDTSVGINRESHTAGMGESINHEVLMNILKRWIKDEKVLGLAGMIIANCESRMANLKEFIPPKAGQSAIRNPQSEIGLPIGNLTSPAHPAGAGFGDTRLIGSPIPKVWGQFFANVYLNELDYFVKFDLRERYYIRYMDDFLIFGNDRKHLTYLKERIAGFLADKLKLSLHDKKSTIFPTKDGVNFLGFRIFRDYRRIQRENVKRFVKRMKQKAWAYRQISPLIPLRKGGTGVVLSDITNSVQSWLAHARHGNTYNLRKNILSKLVFSPTPLRFGDTRLMGVPFAEWGKCS